MEGGRKEKTVLPGDKREFSGAREGQMEVVWYGTIRVKEAALFFAAQHQVEWTTAID